MRIGIDARFIGPEGTGLGKYAEKLIKNLAEIDQQNQYSIFLKSSNWNYLSLTRHKNFTKILADVPWYSLSEQLKLPKILNGQNLDLLHVPHFNVPIFYRGKFIVTIHDLIHHQFSEYAATTKNPLVFRFKRFGYHKVIANAIYKSQKILTPSNFVKSEITEFFKIDPGKVIVTYEAAEEEYFSDYKQQTTNNKLSKKASFLIYVGNAYPHKNLNRLLDAIQITKNIKLIIVSPRDIFWERLNREIDERNLRNIVEMKGYLKPGELKDLFQKATAYIFPSLSEGFGIPGLNAMACNLPVLASDIPTLTEIYGQAALYFNPQDARDIASKIQQIVKEKNTRDDLIEKGRNQLNKYSWQRMAMETLAIYKKCC